MSSTRAIANISLFAVVLMVFANLGCPGGGGTLNGSQLVSATNAGLPVPDDMATLQAVFNSSDSQAMISVFLGTTVPTGGLTIEKVSTDSVDGALDDPGNSFAVRLGPDGATFDPPVRVSNLLGAAIVGADGAYQIPVLEVVTVDGGAPMAIDTPQIEVTDDGLVIAHALFSHFTDAVYRLRLGVSVGITGPAEDSMWLVSVDDIPLGMDVANSTDGTVTIQANETVTGELGALFFSSAPVTIQVNDVVFGVGGCICIDPGVGSVKYVATGQHRQTETDGTITRTDLLVRDTRNVKCFDVTAEMTVFFDSQTHTTFYTVKVFETSESTGGLREDVTDTEVTSFLWDLTSTCGGFDLVSKSVGLWDHTVCPAEAEATSTIKVTVTVKGPGNRDLTFIYNKPARANEGAGPQPLLVP